jgi:hypothetical protein
MKNRVPSVRRQSFLLVAMMVFSLAFRGFSLDLLVYNKNDSGAGSLRQAISDNNALGGGNVILFSNIVAGTITLTGGELLITKDVTVLGPGADVLAIDGNGASTLSPSTIFFITNPAVASLSGLTITNALKVGYGGGLLNLNGSTSTISNCTFSGNVATTGAGIANHGTLTVISSTFDKDFASGGGGIYNDGTLTAISCTFSGNSGSTSGDGGGIENQSVLTVSNCTFSGNGADFGGAIYSSSSGTPTATIISSTFSGNSALGAGNTIYTEGNLILGNTILNSSGTNIFRIFGIITSLGYNLCSDNGGGFLVGVGDQINTAPNLGPLQNNGGPTMTLAPLPGSLAIDQGKSFGLTTDQRGRPRPYDQPGIPNAAAGDGSDIGAVEVGAATLTVLNTNDSGAGSLRQAILYSSPSEGDTVTFSPNVTNLIQLTSGELVIGNSLTIQGPGAKMLRVDGNGSSRVFHLNSGNVGISGLTITNGYAIGNSSGGGIINYAALTLSNCAIVGNVASPQGSGGGIWNRGTITAWNCAIAQNTAFNTNATTGAFGGGIDNDLSGSVSLLNCTIAGNLATSTSSGGYGGGIYSGGSTVALTNCTVASNSAGSGGGIQSSYPLGVAVAVAGSIIASNTASSSGPDVIGGFISGGYNLVARTNGSTGFTNGVNQDQVGSSASPLDPQLGSLKDNGGPTPTMALKSGSPAIDKGKSFGLATDQRGAPRPFDFAASANATGGDASDIGAFELGSPILNILQAGTNAVLSWPWFYGDFTLQSSTNVALPNAWSTAGGTPVVVGSQYQETNGPISDNDFFRLREN